MRNGDSLETEADGWRRALLALIEIVAAILALVIARHALAQSNLPGDVVLPGTPVPGAENGAAPEHPALKAISILVIDPGHGGDDAGARADSADPILEKDVTLAIAKRVEEIVTARTGVRVLLSRPGDIHLGVADRPSFANEARADLFLSIHANVSPSPQAKGFRVYYHDPSGVESLEPALEALPALPWSAAQRDVEEKSARFAESLRESLAAKLTLADRGVKRIPLAVLEGATCPAAMVEIGFLSNHDEALALSTSAVQDAVAEAIADAVLKMDASLAEAEGSR